MATAGHPDQPTNPPEPDRPDDEFIAEVLKEHPELIPEGVTAAAYLEGFDDHADMVDLPPLLGAVERTPEDITVFDRSTRKWSVRTTAGWVVLLRGAPPLRHGGEGRRVITAFNRDNARALSDALTWAASLPSS